MPLARPQTRGVFHARHVPPAVPSRTLPAAHLTPSVGPPSSRNAGVGQTRQRDSTVNNRTSSEHRPNIVRIFSNIVRTYSEHSQAYLDTRGSSRAGAPVAGSRTVWPVAAGMARRRIACRQSRRVRYRPSPATAWGMVVTCGIARRRIACRIACRSITFRRVRSCLSPDHVSSRPGPPRRPHVSAMVTVGCAECPSSAMPRPNIRL